MSGAAGRGRRVVVLGGTSEIALAIVRELQSRAPREVALLGRDPDALARAAEDLTSAGCATALTFELDARDLDRHEQLIGEAVDKLGGVDIVILAIGVLGDRGGLPDDTAGALDVLQVNLVGAGSLLIHSARRLREQGAGTLVVLSSVAGERPRAANVIYGASKAGLDALAQGLGDALNDAGVRVLVVRPGFVAYPHDAGPSARAAGHHTTGARPRRRGRTGPPRPHRLGTARSTLADDLHAHAPPPPFPPPEAVNSTRPVHDISRLSARRRQARRRRYLFRLDIGLALLIAVVALLFAPGVAIVAVAALLILAICGVSVLIERLRSRRL